MKGWRDFKQWKPKQLRGVKVDKQKVGIAVKRKIMKSPNVRLIGRNCTFRQRLVLRDHLGKRI